MKPYFFMGYNPTESGHASGMTLDFSMIEAVGVERVLTVLKLTLWEHITSASVGLHPIEK